MRQKLKLISFGGTTAAPPVDLGYLAQYKKPTIANLGIKMDSDHKLDCQIRGALKSSFFQAAGQIKAYSSKAALWDSTHAFVTSQLD